MKQVLFGLFLALVLIIGHLDYIDKQNEFEELRNDYLYELELQRIYSNAEYQKIDSLLDPLR